MGLLKMLIEDLQREHELKRLDADVRKNLPKQNLRLMRELTACHLAEDCADEKGQEEKMTMEKYINSPEADWDTIQYENEQYVETEYEKAKRFVKRYEIVTECHRDDKFIYITTKTGAWYFHPSEEEVTLYHKNYELRRNQSEYFHVQFTKKYDDNSTEKVISYICKHDYRKWKKNSK